MKICPFCDGVLDSNLWCQKCRRIVVLYKVLNTDEDDVDDVDDADDADAGDCYEEESADDFFEREERSSLYQRLVNSLAARRETLKENIPDVSVKENIPDVSVKEKPDAADVGAVIFFAACACALVICIIMAVKPILSKNVIKADSEITQTSEIISEWTPESTNERTFESTAERIPENTIESTAERTTESTSEWKKILELSPIAVENYGENTYYYYHAEDIQKLGMQCGYYHLTVNYKTIADIFEKAFLPDKAEKTLYEDNYSNTFVDGGDWYLTTFQRQLSYYTNAVTCYINYDTGSEMVHYIGFNADNLENYAELINNVAHAVSEGCDLSPEKISNGIVQAREELLTNHSDDIWYQEYIYQDEDISICMTQDKSSSDLQITSKKYALDCMENNLDITKPK